MTEQSNAVEEETRTEANSSLWFHVRTHQITASKLKAVCSTDLAMPSISLVLSICHPELSKFSTTATLWGCEHEKVACATYSSIHTQGVFCKRMWVFIHNIHPFMGASPDGLISCLCCGEGVCEIKLYLKQDISSTGFTSSTPFLEWDSC